MVADFVFSTLHYPGENAQPMNRTSFRSALSVTLPLILCHPLMLARGDHADSASLALRALAGQIESSHPDWKAGTRITNLTIKRDRGTFFLKDGIAVQCLDIAGGRHALEFSGTGEFTMSFPDDIERQQYRRFTERDSAVIPFTELALFFADSTLEEISRSFRFREFQPAWDDSVLVKTARRPAKYLVEDDDLVFTLLQNERNGYFFAMMGGGGSDNFYFKLDPLQREEISFGRENTSLLHRSLEGINQFHALGSPDVEHTVIRLSEYVIDATIRSNLDFSSGARITYRATRAGLRWFPVYLYSGLAVDSVSWDSGRPAEFSRKEEDPTVWIRCLTPPSPGESHTLRIFYHGDLLTKNGLEWIAIKSPDNWFPRTGYYTRAKFDMTFHYPSKYKLASIGDRVSFRDSDDVATSHWVTPPGVHNSSFNIGLFQEYVVKEKDLPQVTVYMSEMGHRRALSMDENVGADVTNSLSFFTNLFGTTGVGQFFATEIPYGHGEAYPGLIHLSYATFSENSQKSVHEVFRAHEVAHQWWGIGVKFDSYHDQWLSEAFAEYSALWYLQAIMKGNDEFFETLDRYRKDILTNRTYVIGKGQEAGPISLGVRTSSSQTSGDYDLIIYRKGAWVLHMLRQMMLDLNTMNEDRFHALMRGFYEQFRGKRPSTRDFAALVSAYFGKDMQWFFREWIEETQIPAYKFAYRVKESGDGQYRVTCRVLQEGVAPDFTMPIPIKIQFPGDRVARTRIVATGPVTEVELPLLPMKPEEIIFNDLHSVLCTFKNVDWE